MISSILNPPNHIVEKPTNSDHKVIKHNLQAIPKKQNVGNIQNLLNDYEGPSKNVSSVKIIPFHSNPHFIQEKQASNNSNPSSEENKISYRGLKNLGATCYMNSFLQVLFHLPLFRRNIFNIHVGDVDEDHNILLHLQRIFAMMQLSNYSVSTKNLARSFGWSNIETMMQQDIYEFCSVFLEKIDVAIQKVSQNNKFSISSLFKGKYLSTIKCRHVNFQTQTTNVINVCTLDVRGVSSLEESFMNFTALEPLDGSNQYDTGSSYGLQDADMFSNFIELPPVLMLHLKRFDINMETQQNSKIDTFFSFTKNLDLNRYLAEHNKVDCSQYELFGILVHAGTIHSGHYTAYLRPTPESEWYYFNDSEVHIVSEDQAISENFGGPDPFQTKKNKSHCAYMLIYVRIDSIERIFSPVNDNEIPERLKEFVVNNDKQIKFKKQMKEDESQRVKAFVIQVQDLEYLAERTGRILFESNLSVEIKKSMSFDDIYDLVSVLLDTHPLYLTIWVVHENSLKFKLDRRSQKVQDIMNYSTDMNIVKFFVEIDENESTSRSPSPQRSQSSTNAVSKGQTQNQQPEILIFVYSYFPSQKRPFKFTSTVSIHLNESVSAIFDSVRESFDIPSNVNMYSYVYIDKPVIKTNTENANLMFISNPESTIGTLSLVDGSVIIIQPDPYQFSPGGKLNQHLEVTSTGAKIEKENQAYSFMPDFIRSPPNEVTTYFNYISNNRYITVNRLIDPDVHVYLRYPETISISLFKEFIADAFEINYNEERDIMLLYGCNLTVPMSPCVQSVNVTPVSSLKLSDLLNNPRDKSENQAPKLVDERKTKINTIITSDVSEIMIHIFRNNPIQKVLSIRRFICYVFGLDGFRRTNFAFLKENVKVLDLISMFKNSIPEFRNYPAIRVLQYKKGKGISMPLPETMPISQLQNPIRIEAVPKDQFNLSKKSTLMQVFQINSGSRKPVDYISPFLILVNKDDNFALVKIRMKKYFRQRKIKSAKCRFFVVIGEHVMYLNDDSPMKQLVSISTPIYIEDTQKFLGASERSGVKIYT